MMYSELNLEVRYYETDQMGIVHHSNYIRYFECGRTAMLKEAGLPIEKIEEAGVMLPVVSVECRYRTPARLGDVLLVKTMVEEMPKARLVIKSEVLNMNGQMVCEGVVVLGFIDSTTRRPVRCPDMLLNIFEQHIK